MRPIQFGVSHSHPKSTRSKSSSRSSTTKPDEGDQPPAYGEHQTDKLVLSGAEPSNGGCRFDQWLSMQRQAFERVHPNGDEEAFTRYLEQRNAASGLTADHDLDPFEPTQRRGRLRASQAQRRLAEALYAQSVSLDPVEPFRITHMMVPPQGRADREAFHNNNEYQGELRVNRLRQAGVLCPVGETLPRMFATSAYGNFSSTGQGRYANLRERALITHDASELRRLLNDGVHRADLFHGASEQERSQLQELLRRP